MQAAKIYHSTKEELRQQNDQLDEEKSASVMESIRTGSEKDRTLYEATKEIAEQDKKK